MSEDSDIHFPILEDQDGALGCRASTSCSSMPRGASGCSSIAQLHRMGGYSQGGTDLGLPSEGSDSSGQDPPASPHKHRKSTRSRSLPEEDVEMKSSGSSGSGTESHGNESHGNESHGHQSMGSSSNSKDSALLESSESNKSSNSHSPSPPSSSNAFSLLSSEQDNPSTSGCSSQESAKAKTQKELLKTLKELKRHLPAEKKNNNKSSTLNTLKYALRCVKQVEANEEYYQLLMINDSQPSGVDVSSYTIEEIDSITSEYTLKNNDIFAVAVSLITGRIVYISDQAASILNCKREVFKNTKFVEFLTPQDVSVFYSFTTPYRLPSWSVCTGAESSPPDSMQEKSFFCRIGGGKECQGDMQYYPFRMTPYLMKVQDTFHAEDQFCCLLLAERVLSGYDAPRIPTDKRIFTTTHTPSCVFQDVDERAVPLLGYLPQDLIGTSVLLHLHPNDRPLMLAIHRKILQFAGQPFDHSSIRFCARNGEYIILDTSWSSFVNPWSRKVSFVIGRHKVRMGPVNEDVFVAPVSSVGETKTMDSEIQEITEQIHRLLLQPVHNSGSSGYGSLNSNDHLLGISSTGESVNKSKMLREEEELSSKARPRTFQEICKGIHLQKSQELQTTKPENKKSNGIESVQKSPAVVRPKDSAAPLNCKEAWSSIEESQSTFQEELNVNDQIVHSYQQISCLDSVMRYLEGCNVPITMKRKCQSSSNTTSSNSDEDRPKGSNNMELSEEPALLKDQSASSTLDDQDKKSSDAATAVVGTSLPLPVPNKPESVVSITSQCSYSSTIVHVGDKKPQPESEIIEDVPGTETAESCQNTGAPPRDVSPPSQEREAYKKLGLTKQVLAAHTQKEEQSFLRQLRKLTTLKENCSQYLERQREQTTSDAAPAARSYKQAGQAAKPITRRGTRNKKTKLKRMKQTESSDSTGSHHRQQQLRPPLLNHGLNPTSWSPSETSQSTFPMAYPTMMPGYPLQGYPRASSIATHTEATLASFGDNHGSQAPPYPPSIHPVSYVAPMVPPITPIVALVLPNYMYSPIAPGPPPPLPMYHAETGGFPTQTQPFFPAAYPGQGTFTAQPSFGVQNQFIPQNHFAPPAGCMTPSFHFPPPSEIPKGLVETLSRPSTPQSGLGEGPASPPLFHSGCSSPLNLLELELSADHQDNAVLPSGGQGNNTAEREKGSSGNQTKPSLNVPGPPGPLYCEGTSCVCGRLSWDKVCSRLSAYSKEASLRGDGNNSDANSSSSGMLDILLQEDSCSGTGSATSGSMGSGSNGCGTSASGTSNSGTSKSRTSASGASASGTSGSGTGSNNSSKYFGSVDSSQNSREVKGHLSGSDGRPVEMEQGEDFLKSVLQDPLWLLMANTDDKVMKTYQLPSRDIESVLREDREKLRLLQKSQPHFSEEQKKELLAVHPWIKKGGLPKAIDIKVCSCCNNISEAATAAAAAAAAAVEDPPDLDITYTDTGDVGCRQTPREEPSNNFVISCLASSPDSRSQTQ